jgi:hypothetical protein
MVDNPRLRNTRTPFACTEVTRASFFAQTAQPSVGLIENEIRKSANSVIPPLSMTSANLLKQSARNVGPVILIPESSMAYHDRNWRSVSLTLRIIWHRILRAIWHNCALRKSAMDSESIKRCYLAKVAMVSRPIVNLPLQLTCEHA